MTLTEQYEQASIQDKENAAAIAVAVQAAQYEGTEVHLISRTVPFPNAHLRIQGPRWFVRIGGKTLYRVWRSEETWQAAQVKEHS